MFKKPKVLFFDLFHTLLHDRKGMLPTVTLSNQQVVPSTAPILWEHISLNCPHLRFERFLSVLHAQWNESQKVRETTHQEIPAHVRFGKVAQEIGLDPIRFGQDMLLLHRKTLLAATYIPEENIRLVEELAKEYTLGLITNYDDALGPAQMLDHAGILDHFENITVSGAEQYAKPHPELFYHALNQYDIKPKEAWYIGDDWNTDVVGALKVGMKPVWLNHKNKPLLKKNVSMIQSLAQLPSLVAN